MLNKNWKYLWLAGLFAMKSFAESLPANIKWLTNDSDPEFADPEAKRGGTFNVWMSAFPPSIRFYGPDSNDSFATYMRDITPSLVETHPNTGKIIPLLATHWAYDDDGKTMYFKINPKATWSDGKPLTADDFIFTKELGKSKVIVSPWDNDYWSKEVSNVIKIDDLTIGVVSAVKRPIADLHLYNSITATPKHAFGGKLPEEYVKTYNWKILPNLGPYYLDTLNKGKSITFKRRKSWFLDNERFYRGRFNADTIQFDLIRDINVAWEMFKKSQLQEFAVLNPVYWNDKANDPLFKKGYINKIWFYTDGPQTPMGFWLNEKMEPLNDKNVRIGIAHSINIEDTIKKMLRGEYERLEQHYVGYGDYTDNSIKARRYDIAEADKYFSKAGWSKKGEDGIRVKDGKRLSFTITYGSEIMNGRLAFIKEEAKKCGLELNLQLMDGTASFKYAQSKKHQIVYSAWTTGIRPAFYEHYHSDFAGKPDNNNFSNTGDPELDKLIDRQRLSTEEKERIELSKQIERMVHDRAAFIPSFSLPFYREAYWRWMRLPKTIGMKLADSSFSPTSMSSGGIFWIDEKMKEETLAAMKSGKTFPETVIIDKTYKIKK